MHGIFTYIWPRFMVNVAKYTIHMDPVGVESRKRTHLKKKKTLSLIRFKDNQKDDLPEN